MLWGDRSGALKELAAAGAEDPVPADEAVVRFHSLGLAEGVHQEGGVDVLPVPGGEGQGKEDAPVCLPGRTAEKGGLQVDGLGALFGVLFRFDNGLGGVAVEGGFQLCRGQGFCRKFQGVLRALDVVGLVDRGAELRDDDARGRA